MAGCTDYFASVSPALIIWVRHTVKPVLSGHSKINNTKIFMTNGSLIEVGSIVECSKGLMKVESIAECSPWSILQYF